MFALKEKDMVPEMRWFSLLVGFNKQIKYTPSTLLGRSRENCYLFRWGLGFSGDWGLHRVISPRLDT